MDIESLVPEAGNLTHFIEQFEVFASAPDGIIALKNLIMGLGLRGRLLPQESNLASLNLQNIDQFRKLYSKNTNRKLKEWLFKDALLEEFDIPQHWSWYRVGNICDIQTGATPSKQKPEYFGGDIKWMVSGDINKGEIYDCKGRITPEGQSASNCKLLPKNIVMMALNGQGKTRATVALLRTPATCNQSLVGIIPISEQVLTSEYLFIALKYRYYEIREITGQKQRRGLNMGLVAELSVSLPPLEEQKRIVAKVDELMALCDKLEAQQQQQANTVLRANTAAINALLNPSTPETSFEQNWQRIAQHFNTLYGCTLPMPKGEGRKKRYLVGFENLKELRETLLDLAVKGLLSHSKIDDSNIKNILDDVFKEKLDLNLTKNEFQLINKEYSSALNTLANNRVMVKARLICHFITKGTTPAKNELLDNENIPFLKVYNIVNGKIDFQYKPVFISDKVHKNKLKRSVLYPNDVVMNIVGPPLRKVAIIPTDYPEWNMNQALAIMPQQIQTRN